MPDLSSSATGRKTSVAISRTASRGVQCSPASSLFSSLKRRTNSSKIEPHPVVVEARIPDRAVSVLYRGWAEVDVQRGDLLDERTQGVGLREPRDLVAELEVLENVLYVGREAVKVGLEVGPELLPARAGPEVAQGELRGVVEGLSRRLPESRVLLDDAGLVEHRLHLEHVRLAVYQHRVQPAQHRHRQDDVPGTCRGRRGLGGRRRRSPRCSSRSSAGRRYSYADDRSLAPAA